VAQLLIALLVVSFAVWGVSGFFTGFNADVVATVGNTEITVRQFARNYEATMRQVSQQLGQQITPDQAQMFGLPQQVLGRLIADATLTDEAGSMGLGISNEALSKEIAGDSAFQDPSGNFDRVRFVQLLQNAGLTEDQYVQELRTGYIRQQIVDGLAGETKVPEAFMRALHDYRSEERSLSWIVLRPDSVGAVPEPTETDVTAYFDAHKSDWAAPEYRAVTLMRLTPADVADASAVTDADAQALYERVVATRFTTPEKRQVQQIVFDTKAEGEAAAAAITSGKTFDDILAERNLTPTAVDLGLIARTEIIDPKVGDAAFGLPAGGVSPLIEGQFGPVIVRVVTIEPEGVTPFAEVKDTLKEEIAESRAAQEIADQLDVIEDARAGGSTLEEIATNYDLTLRTIPAVDASGRDADGNPIADIPGGQALVTAVYESDVGLENNPIPADEGYVWYTVTSVAAARDRELAEVREKVIAAWKAAEVQKRLAERAEEIRTQLKDGGDLAAIAATTGLTVETAVAVKRGADAPIGLPAPAVDAAFGGPRGYAAVADGEGGTKLVVTTTEVTIPPYFSGAPDLVQPEEQFSGEMANDLLSQYVFQLQDQLGVSVNQAALQTAIGSFQSGPGL
jgi:peptidyl-prolyl cis-trans isomerase D